MTRLVYAMVLFKDWEQARRVIERLDGPEVTFLVHIDRKTNPDFVRDAHAYLGSRANCHFLRRRSVYWGAWGLTQVMIDGARYIGAHDVPCDHYIYMSGQDYPLVSNDEIHAFFAEHPHTQFLEHFELPYEHWPHQGLDRVESFHLQVWRRHVSFRLRAIERRLPEGYRYHGGSAAIILADNGVAYLNAFLTTRTGRRLLRYFRLARHADEIFFQTVFLNSELRGTVVNDELRYVDWQPPTGPPPKILGMEDLGALRASGKLFARKFSREADSEVLDALDAAARV